MEHLRQIVTSFAAKCAGVETSIIECKSDAGGGIIPVLLDLISALAVGIGILAVIGITVVGIQYLKSKGNVEKTAKARRRMLEIVIGLAIYAMIWGALEWLMPGGALQEALSGGREGTDSVAINLGSESISMNIGRTRVLGTTVLPFDAKDKSLTWESSNAAVATVDKNGKVEAKAEGDATIVVTTVDGKTDSIKITVSAPAPEGGDDDDPPGGPSDTDRSRIGNALAAMHADEDGGLEKVRRVVARRYWGMECDYQYANGQMYCNHDYAGGVTLRETMDICKAGGTKVILDMKSSSDAAVTALANYLKSNNLEDWVVVQTNYQSVMRKLNELTGHKLEYWGLIMNDPATLNEFLGDARTYKDLGVTTINFPLDISGWRVGSQENIERTKRAGYDIAIFTWVYFGRDDVTKYDNYGVKYLVTSYMCQLSSGGC